MDREIVVDTAAYNSVFIIAVHYLIFDDSVADTVENISDKKHARG